MERNHLLTLSVVFQGSLFYNLQNQHLAAMKEILPRLIGKDPRETARINDIMDLICPFQSYAKSTIDIACWDILGKVHVTNVVKAMGRPHRGSL